MVTDIAFMILSAYGIVRSQNEQQTVWVGVHAAFLLIWTVFFSLDLQQFPKHWFY